MAGKSDTQTETLPLGKGHTLLMSPTQGQADIIGATFAPAISQSPRGQLYGWLPLSDASGILIANGPMAFSLLTTPICCLWHHSLHETKQSKHARAAA
jgi:hypothetical protein